MSNKSLTQLVFDLRKQVSDLVAEMESKNSNFSLERFASVAEARITTLENQYRMLNARLNKKNNNGEDPDRRRDPGKT